jgi:tripartite-type tricarboxylate transporter receptor subunit TctC
MMWRRAILAGAAAAPVLAARPGAAQQGAAWRPDRPMRLIIPFPAGGPSDLFGRVFAEAFGARLGQPVVVENRAGVGGVLGVDVMAKAPPDGLTLAVCSAGALTIAPSMPQQRMPFDPMRDIAHLTLLVKVPEVLAVHPAAGFATLKDLIDAAKARPGALQYGSSGVGSITHLAGALLCKEAGIDMIHVPYRGAAPAVTDLIANRFAFTIADVPVLLPHLQAGTLKALAITSARRVGALPGVPTTAEAGYPGVLSDNWYGLGAPEATSPAILGRLHAVAMDVLRDPAVVREYTRVAGVPSPIPREEYTAFLRTEREKWAPIVRASGAESL